MKRLHKFYFALIITLSIFSVSFAQNRISNQQEMSTAHYIRTNLATLFPEWIYGDIDTMVAGSQRETIKLLLAK